MTWDELCAGLKKTADIAADKINQSTDLAALRFKLSMAERRISEAYAALGKVAYLHLTADDGADNEEANAANANAVSKACAAVTAAIAARDALQKQINEQQKNG